jgi:hypothetical protein
MIRAYGWSHYLLSANHVAAQEQTIAIKFEHEVTIGNPLVAGSRPDLPTIKGWRRLRHIRGIALPRRLLAERNPEASPRVLRGYRSFAGCFVVDLIVLVEFEIDEGVDHCVIHAAHHVCRHPFVGSPLLSLHHHGGAALGCSYRIFVSLVACSVFDELLTSGQQPDDLLVDLIDLRAHFKDRHAIDRTGPEKTNSSLVLYSTVKRFS